MTANHSQALFLTLEKYKERAVGEKRLLSLYVTEVSKTGRCDDPEFVTQIDAAYEIDTAPAGTVLSPPTIVTLYQNLDTCLFDIDMARSGIHEGLSQVVAEIQAPSGAAVERAIRKLLETNLQILNKATSYLLDTARRFASVIKGKEADDRQGDASDDVQAELDYRKLVDDIRYIRQYLFINVQISTIKQELLPEDNPDLYLARLRYYIDALPKACGLLIERTKIQIQDRKTNKKFAPP